MSALPSSASGDANLFRNAAARNYLFVGLTSLLIVAAVMFVRGGGSLPAAVIPALIGAAGLLMRWSAVPVIALFVLAYFIVMPFGIPMSSPNDIPGSAFRLLDIILVAAVLAYFGSQYRLLSLTRQAMPYDGPTRPRGTSPNLRPASIVADDEFSRMFWALGACVLFGQVLWVVIASFQLDFLSVPPLTFHSDVFAQPRGRFGEGSHSTSQRFLMFVLIVGAASLVAGLMFWYWRLSQWTRAEGAMILLDARWRDGRREFSRQEKWRAWGVQAARRKAGLVEELPVPPKPWSVGGCLRVALLVILGPIAVVVIGRLLWAMITN